MGLLFGIVVGFSLGLTGGGGSIFAVPMLVYGLNMPAHQAVAVSLAAVGATALGGVLTHLRTGEAEIRIGIIFGLAGIVGAPLGAWLGHRLSAEFLLAGFSILMLMVAIRMWRQANRKPARARVIRALPEGTGDEGPGCRRDPEGNLQLTSRCGLILVLAGVVTGFMSGLFGVGGGFLIVPALLLIASLSIQRAVATSLVVIAIISGAGVVSHGLAGQAMDWGIMAQFVTGGLIGMGLGIASGRRIAGPQLQKLFAAMMVMVAGLMLFMLRFS